MTNAIAPRQSTLADMRKPQAEPTQNLPSISVGLTTLQGFELAQRAAKMLAASSLVPKEYQGNLPNCVIALNMAARVGADALMVMQNLVIVHGRPTWSAQFLIATVNTSGRFSALRYEFFGTQGKDDWGCRAWAIELATGEKLVGTDVTIAIAKKEGWYSKNGSKWQSIPQQMLMYRAGSWWTRAYAPELSMGLHTADEMADVYDTERGEDGTFRVTSEAIRQAVPADIQLVGVQAETTGPAGGEGNSDDSPEPYSFTDNHGEVHECTGAEDFAARFILAMGKADSRAMVDGLWETNSPLLQWVREDGFSELAMQAAETYDAALHRVAKPAEQQAQPAESKPAQRKRANLFNGEQ